MAIKTIFIDDLDGSELGELAEPVVFALDGLEYQLHLSSANHQSLRKLLEPYIEAAAVRSVSRGRSKKGSPAKYDADYLKLVRQWARSTGYEYTNNAGETVTLGDRGRIPHEVIEAYQRS